MLSSVTHRHHHARLLRSAAALLRRHLTRALGGEGPLPGAWNTSLSGSNALCSGAATAAATPAPNRTLCTLVLAERSARSPSELSGATRSAIAAARQLLKPVHVLVAGASDGNNAPAADALAATTAAVPGVGKVVLAKHTCLAHLLAPPTAALLASVARTEQASCVVAGASTFGKDVVPRAAALLGVQPVPDVVRVLLAGGSGDGDKAPFAFVHPIYAGNALETVRYNNAAKGGGYAPDAVLTVRPTAFAAAAEEQQAAAAGAASAAPVEPASAADLAAAEAEAQACPTAWVSDSSSLAGSAAATTAPKPELASARVVVCGGRALKSADNFAALERLAALLGGAVGASRAAVDAGYVPNDLQVGQTGKVVAPELYIAVGISGAIQHVAGMKDSRVVVAVNTDAEAPIFGLADYGLVADWQVALPELEARLKELKAKAGG
jgi:electron transfer flavoprotein alpha subunit